MSNTITAARQRKKIKDYIFKTFIPTTALIVFSVIFIFPLFWLISSSLQTSKEIFSLPPKLLPETPQWSNYIGAFKAMPVLRYFKNSLILSLAPVAGQYFGSAMTAYSLARIRWRGSKYVFAGIIVAMMIPSPVTMIPIYIMMSKIHWTGTMLPLTVLPFLGYPYYVFMLRQFFKTIPGEISEAARIDGAGEIRTYVSIMLPLAGPALAAVGILTFTFAWNDFMMPLIYLGKATQWPLAVGLYNFQQQHAWDWEKLMAVCTIYVIPMILIFLFGQKQFIKGIATTGFK